MGDTTNTGNDTTGTNMPAVDQPMTPVTPAADKPMEGGMDKPMEPVTPANEEPVMPMPTGTDANK